MGSGANATSSSPAITFSRSEGTSGAVLPASNRLTAIWDDSGTGANLAPCCSVARVNVTSGTSSPPTDSGRPIPTAPTVHTLRHKSASNPSGSAALTRLVGTSEVKKSWNRSRTASMSSSNE